MRAFSAVLGQSLPYDDMAGVRARLAAVNPVFAVQQTLERRGCNDSSGPATDTVMSSAPFEAAVVDYYQTNPISRASVTMAECTRTYNAPVLQAAE